MCLELGVFIGKTDIVPKWSVAPKVHALSMHHHCEPHHMQKWLEQFAAVRYLSFTCHNSSDSQTDWNHQGSGKVAVRVQDNDVYFNETFVLDNGRHCHDQKLWCFAADGNEIVFCRHYQGQWQEIFRFRQQDKQWQLMQHYYCAPDHYSGSLKSEDNALCFTIRIIGTRKNETLCYRYTASA